MVTSTPYDFTAKFESTDAGAYIVLEDNGSTNNANYIGVNGDTLQFFAGASLQATMNVANVVIEAQIPHQIIH